LWSTGLYLHCNKLCTRRCVKMKIIWDGCGFTSHVAQLGRICNVNLHNGCHMFTYLKLCFPGISASFTILPLSLVKLCHRPNGCKFTRLNLYTAYAVQTIPCKILLPHIEMALTLRFCNHPDGFNMSNALIGSFFLINVELAIQKKKRPRC
jgi:hypothetical protein